MLLNSLSDGPAMVLSPRQEHAFLPFQRQSKFGMTVDSNTASYFGNGLQSHAFSSPAKPTTPAPVVGKPSRKRSRDEADFEEARNAPSAPPMPAPAPAPKKEEPIYGEGMVLLNPHTGLALSADSQTGTWYEENLANSAAPTTSVSSQQQASIPSIPGRKSQRLDPSAPSLDDIALSSMQRQISDDDDNRRLLDAANRSSPSSGEPLVDDATLLLGISWQRIAMDDADIAAAVRGWKKYIDRQFSTYLVDSEIMMKNRALNAYLVTARPVTPLGAANNVVFFLFNDELTQAQLVGSTWETCVHNLRSNPIMFEGTQVLNASDRPMGNESVQPQSVLGMNPADAGLPLLQTLSAQPSLNNDSGAGIGGGMEIDA
ncbi:hypothetical protein FE257_012507 [Aspergillus nanangensis]|uniref:Uncharacterized protein n=1 Tax=Aspergillus nanangensis TaxID=2582783 RepID=A0AAD4GXP2_ASPNN|nr:hypothetical protein FE257_012507 [Aspergillus nanangensis]